MLSERTKDFLNNCHGMSEETRKEMVPYLLQDAGYQPVIDDLRFEFAPESFEEMVYNIINNEYYNAI